MTTAPPAHPSTGPLAAAPAPAVPGPAGTAASPGTAAGPVAASARPAADGGPWTRLVRLTGLGFLPLALLARLPMAMVTVGTLTLATAVTGSYAAGGLAAGAVGIGAAAGGPLAGALADRAGQRPVLLVLALLHAVSTALLLAAAHVPLGPGGPALPAVVAAALLVGATCPPVGPLVRVRWRALAGPDRRTLDTALSYESTADELTFVLGPALVGLLASLVAPWLPFVLSALLVLLLVPAFALHPSGRAVAGPARHGAAGPPVPMTPRERVLVLLPVLGMVAMGTFFGALQNGLAAFGGRFGLESAAGLLYAVLGLSSAAAALSVAWWPQRLHPRARWVGSAAAMAGLSLLLLAPATVPAMVVALLIAGIPVGPVMVTIFTVGGDAARPERQGTVMTLLAGGVVLGSALGAALAGSLAELAGPDGAFAAAIGAAAAMVLVSTASARLTRARP
ncbi:MFS transporter [Kocuria flava]|uniref:MFS transporter n=1 Tax=Kocuria flava TaxID=446860 RepID=UPI001FF5339B|nr:MFS transporter [Kocuria flava]MCJ8504915.1 MFS transporter [Kocuria flava]